MDKQIEKEYFAAKPEWEEEDTQEKAEKEMQKLLLDEKTVKY